MIKQTVMTLNSDRMSRTEVSCNSFRGDWL